MPKKRDNQKSYRQLSDELDGILLWFEGEDIDLDEAVKKYSQAVSLIAEMEQYLKNAENEVKKISADFEKK